jgi:hypothetical protein
MIHFRAESEDIKNGFNIYPLSDKGSHGFIFVIFGPVKCYRWWVRYSTGTGRWVFMYDKFDHVVSARILENWSKT